MELSPKQQISELIKQSQRILVVSHKNAGGDAVGSMLALERVLAKAGKEVTLVLSENLDENLSFLPGIEKVKKDVTGARDLIIRISKDRFPIEKLSYNEEDGFLNIVLTPKGALEKNNLEFTQSQFKFDLIFVLDTADVEKIDAIYDRYTELFFETPIVNVDHHSGNEYFGTVNMVDLTATSTAEILVSIIEAMGPGNFDADVATCLLTGIIADTASFKNTNTTPKSLTISAQMLAAGARQQEVIQNLYKTRPLATLKLWGRVLSNMEYDQEHRMVISTISLADFTESGGNADEIHGVMDELLSNAPGTDVVLLLAETAKGKITGKLKGMNGSDVLVIAEAFGGSGHVQSAGFDMANASLNVDKDTILLKVRAIRDRQLGRVAEQSTINNQQSTEITDENSSSSKVEKQDSSRLHSNNNEVVATPPVILNEVKDPEILRGAQNDNAVAPISPLSSPTTCGEPVESSQIESNQLIGDLPEADAGYPCVRSSSLSDEAHLRVDDKEDNGVSDEDLASLDELVESESTADEDFAHEEEMAYNEIFTPAAVTTAKEDEITQAIKSIDDEIEGVNEITPNIDIEDTKTKKEALQQIGEVIRGYNPGRPVEDPSTHVLRRTSNGEQPVDPTIWK